MTLLRIMIILLATLGTVGFSSAQNVLQLQEQFPTIGGIGLAFDPASDTIWTFGGSSLRQYSRSGTLLNTFAAPGESADDADLDFADEPIQLGAMMIPAGTLLMTNGETAQAEVFAINPSNGKLITTLETQFGNSHVVGSAFNPFDQTIFMVQDSVPVSEFDNLVGEIDPITGEVLNSFDLDLLIGDFSVCFGDLEVSSVTGNLLIISSSETEILELSPDGVEISRWSQESFGSISGSGIALDDQRNEVYVQSVGGLVSRYLIIKTLLGDINLDGVVNLLDIAPLVDLLTSGGFQVEADINEDGIVDLLDVPLFVEILTN